jgi:hypothetical protein
MAREAMTNNVVSEIDAWTISASFARWLFGREWSGGENDVEVTNARKR